MLPDAVPVLGFVTLQRLGELWLSARNEKRLRARGAYEVGRGHYPLIVVLHTAWLGGLWALAWNEPADWRIVAAYAAVQIGRYWAIASLGDRWTTRLIVLPGAPLVRSGPYRFVPHPNYIVVALEIALLPLAFGLVGYAVAFTAANAALLAWRMHVEDSGLRTGPAVPRSRPHSPVSGGEGPR